MISHSKTRVTITVPKEMNAIIEALADALGKTKSEVIIIAVDTYIRSLDTLLEKNKK